MPTKEMERFAARCLLDRGFIFQDADEALEGCKLDPSEEAVVRACWSCLGMRTALEDYWKAYGEGRAEGAIPSVREPWYD